MCKICEKISLSQRYDEHHRAIVATATVRLQGRAERWIAPFPRPGEVERVERKARKEARERLEAKIHHAAATQAGAALEHLIAIWPEVSITNHPTTTDRLEKIRAILAELATNQKY